MEETAAVAGAAHLPFPVGARLDSLAALAEKAGTQRLAADARSLADRLTAGLFYVALVGQSKRGKSTLLNALINQTLLPMGVAPVTSVVTVVRYGLRLEARARFLRGQWQAIEPSVIAAYVSEEQNAENRRGVVAVEVFVPGALLAEGMCLVDTPGLGSVFAGDTEATRAFLPQIDVALVVLGSDPPISGDELDLVRRISSHCPHILFALNKSDRSTDAEREQARKFTLRVLTERLGQDTPRLFELSATERLAGAGPGRDWSALVATLQDLARGSGNDIVRAAEARGAAHVAERLRHHLDEGRNALLRPAEESERRVEALRLAVTNAERSLNDLGHLLAAEESRLGRVFAVHRDEFLKLAVPEARREHAEALRTCPAQRGPALRARGVEFAHTIANRRLDEWLAEVQPVAEALYVEAARRFTDLANTFLENLAGAGDPALSDLPGGVNPEAGFRARSRLYYTYLMATTSRSPFGWALDILRTRAQQVRALDRELGDYLGELLFVNGNRIENDFRDRVLESRRGLESEIRSCLREMLSSAERALERAKEQMDRGDQAVQGELARIESLQQELSALVNQGKGSGREADR